MNHICRTIWNETTQNWVAASELAKGRTKGSSSAKKSLFATTLLGTLSTAFASSAMAFTPTVTNETVTDEILGAGDHQAVTIGGIANNTTISNGGSQTINNGGIANTTTLNNGGNQTITSNGIANDTVINSGSWQWIQNGGVSYGTVINFDGDQVIFEDGVANNTIINSGMQTVHGTANDTIVYAGGEQYIETGTANNTVIDGGLQDILSGFANNTIINNGGIQEIRYSTANNTTINAGQQSVHNNSIANGTTINDGGWQFVDGGVVNQTTINAGGYQALMSGTANGTVINADGYQAVHAGGIANSSTIYTGGEQFVDIGGTANNSLINGGLQTLYGTANNTVANAGEIDTYVSSILGGITQINGTAIIGGDLITNEGTLIFNPTTQNTVTTEITGSGDLAKTGAGTLVLNNTHTYTGGTSVSGGRLIVGGTAADSNASISGAVNVLNGGTLGGHGQIDGAVTVHGGGKVNPGNSIGTLTVGNAHFMGGSTFEVGVNPDGTNDKLVASTGLGAGTVQIDNGANLVLLGGAGAWNDSTNYTLIDTDHGVMGTFTNVNSNLAFLTPVVDYSNSNQVNLTMTRNSASFGSAARSHNEKGAGGSIESLGPTNPIYQQILGMSASQARNAYNNLSGEIHASAKSALLENSRYPRHAILEHLDRTNVQNTPQTERNLWVNTWAHDGHLKDDGNAARLDNKGAGFIVGADLYQNGTTTIGAALGYEQSDLKAGDLRHSDADAKAIHLMAYGQTELGPVDLKAGIGYSRFNIDSKRDVVVGSVVSQNSAKYNAGLVQIFAEGSHTFDINEQARVAPYAGLLYQHISTDGFTEKGLAAQLQGHSSTDNTISTTLGVRGQWDINPSSNLYANLGWQHSFGDLAPETSLNFIGSMPYNVKGVQTNRDSALIGLGANFELQPNLSLNVGYDGQFGNRSVDHGVKVGLNFNF